MAALAAAPAAAEPCTAAADALDVGDAPDLMAIKMAYEKVCASDCAEACVAAGQRARGLTLARARCAAGDADGCHLAGALGETTSFGRELRLRDASCSKGDFAACDAAASLLAGGIGMRRNEERAAAFARRACLAGRAESCHHFAMIIQPVQNDIGLVKDWQEKAGPVLERGCAAGDLRSCDELERFDSNDDDTDAEKARDAAFSKRGRAGLNAGCGKDPGAAGCPRSKALVARLKGPCARGEAEACHRVAETLRFAGDHDDIAREEARGMELERRACSLGHPEACYEVACSPAPGDVVPNEKERARALRRLGQSCDLGDASRCARLADLFDSDCSIPSEQQDDGRARRYYRRACDLGDGEACFSLGRRLEGNPGLRAMRRACAMNVTQACNELSD